MDLSNRALRIITEETLFGIEEAESWIDARLFDSDSPPQATRSDIRRQELRREVRNFDVAWSSLVRVISTTSPVPIPGEECDGTSDDTTNGSSDDDNV